MRELIAAVLCSLAIATAAVATDRGVVDVTSPHPRFVMVLSVGGEAKPDLASYGATEEYRWLNRVFIRVSVEKARELSAHPGVHYVQQILGPGETSDFAPAPRRPEAEAIAANAVTSPNWDSGNYKYDGSGNVVNIGTDYYVYDPLNRLTKASLTGTGGAYDTYTYDSFANLVHRGTTLSGGPSSQSIPVNGWDNRINGAAYDQAGNLQSGGELPYGFEYDPFRMVIHRYGNGGQQHYYVYDSNDERIGSLNNGAGVWNWTTRDLDGQVIRVYESPGWTSASWIWIEDFARRGRIALGSERMAADGGRRHFHHDHLGTTRMVTNHAGQALSRHDYTPYGLETTSIRQEHDRGYDRVNTMTFTGHERDYDGGTFAQNTDYSDYMHARYYRPGLGRFLTVDPSEQSIIRNRPQTWNRYAYVLNNPLNYIDPYGELWFRTGKGWEWFDADKLLIKFVDKNGKVVSTKMVQGIEQLVVFNGTSLTYHMKDGKSASFPAVSGRVAGWGLTDPSKQAVRNEGPIPAGTYSFEPKDIQFYGNISLSEKLQSSVLSPVMSILGGKAGEWPGGTYAWGAYRVFLKPDPTTEVYGRSGFSIHGGRNPGSAGCIDLCGNINGFMGLIDRGAATIPVSVEYPKNQ